MKKSINTKSTKINSNEKINLINKNKHKARSKNNFKQYIFEQIGKLKKNRFCKICLDFAWYVNIPLVLLSYVLIINKIYPINIFWNIIYYSIYYIFFGISIYSIYLLKNERLKQMIIIVGIFANMLNIFNFALFIPCISYVFLFSKKSRIFKLLIMFIPITISIIAFSMYISINNFTKKTEIETLVSPNKNYIVRHITYDAGVVGKNERVLLEKRYRFFMLKKEKQIYIDTYGANINIKFKDNKHLILNGREIDITI